VGSGENFGLFFKAAPLVVAHAILEIPGEMALLAK
jgi:hypothetical protein